MSDLVITLCVIGVFAFCVWKHKKKKQKTAEVQTSELVVTSATGLTALSPFGNGAMTPYPMNEQGGISFKAVNLRTCHTMFEVESEIETAVVNLREKALLNGKTAFFQYVPVGTTLLIVCLYV